MAARKFQPADCFLVRPGDYPLPRPTQFQFARDFWSAEHSRDTYVAVLRKTVMVGSGVSRGRGGTGRGDGRPMNQGQRQQTGERGAGKPQQQAPAWAQQQAPPAQAQQQAPPAQAPQALAQAPQQGTPPSATTNPAAPAAPAPATIPIQPLDPRYRDLICFNCGLPGHYINNYVRPRLCFMCSRAGHHMDNCLELGKKLPVA